MAGVPRGPSNFDPWQGWEISARNPFLPVGEYTNEAGDVSAGWAMPSIVSEPVSALARLLSTPGGTMPNPQNPEMQQDALTGLLSLYGGNAVSGMARGGRNALATKALSDTGQPSPVGSAIASSADRAATETGSALTPRPGEGVLSPNLPRVDQLGGNLQGYSQHLPSQQGQGHPSLTTSDLLTGSLGTPIGSFLDKNYYPSSGLNPMHEVQDWAKVRSMARKAINGDHVPGYLYDGLPGNGNLLAGTHRSAANELLDKLNYKQRIDSVSLDDVLDDPASYGLTSRNAKRLREAVEDGEYDLVDDIWDQSRDTTLFSDTGRPSIMGSAIGSALDMSPEARLARAREQGFDTDATWYHGTDRDFDAFDNDLATFGIGTWFSDTKHYADWMHGGRGRTLETRLRMRNPYHYDVMEEALKLRDDYGDGFVEPRTSREALQLLSGSGGIDNFVANLASKARQKGHDSLILRNFDDRESGFSGPNKAAAIVFDPSNIRSVNAAFDPARVGENGLLLSDTGRPSIMGSAVAASGDFDPYADIPPWLLGLDERVTY